MGTSSKLNSTERSRRAIRKQVRQRVGALAESFRVTGDTRGYLAYSALLSILKRTTDHKQFLAYVVRAGQQETANAERTHQP